MKILYINMEIFGEINLNNSVVQSPVRQPTKTNTVSSEKATKAVPPKGTTDRQILSKAPSAGVVVQGQKKLARFVVDTSKNILYKYNDKGQAVIAYSVATGAKNTPTHKGVNIITHTETYPYKQAPAHTKRRKNPGAYGPRIIMLNVLDPKTGERTENGEFIHGNCNPSSLGQNASHGCVRMDNDVIKELSNQVKAGELVKII